MPLRFDEAGKLLAGLNGCPQLLGTIVATTTKNNHDTASAFNNTAPALTGKLLMVQPDAACYIMVGALNTTTATTSHVKLDAGEKFYIAMSSTLGYVACVSVSGTTNLRVFELV